MCIYFRFPRRCEIYFNTQSAFMHEREAFNRAQQRSALYLAPPPNLAANYTSKRILPPMEYHIMRNICLEDFKKNAFHDIADYCCEKKWFVTLCRPTDHSLAHRTASAATICIIVPPSKCEKRNKSRKKRKKNHLEREKQNKRIIPSRSTL